MIDTMRYRGKLTQDQQDLVDEQRGILSTRAIAKEYGLPYGQVRGYVEWSRQNPRDLIEPPKEGPKILIFDIETSPQVAMGFFHTMYKVRINDIVRHSHFLTFAYKWLGQDEIGIVSQRDDPDYEPGTEDDFYVAVRLHKLFTEADIVIAHYGDRFDIPYANERFLFNDLGTYPPIQSIDTKAESSRHFKTVSHSLANRTKKHGLDGKMENSGWKLWRECLEGKVEAWDEMEKYNVIDVEALEGWYLKIRPWIGQNNKKKHPNLGHFYRTEDPVCPNCGGKNLVIRRWTPHRTQHYEYATMHCNPKKGGCGRYSRQTGTRRRIEPEDRIYAK